MIKSFFKSSFLGRGLWVFTTWRLTFELVFLHFVFTTFCTWTRAIFALFWITSRWLLAASNFFAARGSDVVYLLNVLILYLIFADFHRHHLCRLFLRLILFWIRILRLIFVIVFLNFLFAQLIFFLLFLLVCLFSDYLVRIWFFLLCNQLLIAASISPLTSLVNRTL